MGSSQSTKLEMLNTVINETVTNITSSKISTTTVTATVNMGQVIKNNNITCAGSLNISQNSVIDFKTMEEFTDIDTKQLQRAVANAIESEMAAGQDSELELGALGFSDQDVNQLIKNRVENLMETNISTEVINSTIVNASTTMSQEVIGNVLQVNGSCTISQDSFIKANVSKITNLVTNTLIKDEVLNEIVSEQESVQKAKLTGFATLIDSVGGILGGPFLIFLIIIGLAIIIVPGMGGALGGGKGLVIALMLVLFGIGIYLLIDWLVLSPTSSVTKYGSIEALAPEDVEEDCGDIWYEEDTQDLLEDMNKIEKDDSLDDDEKFQKRGEYLYNLSDAVLCGKLKSKYLKKGKAYDKLYTCLAKNGHIDPDTMSGMNIMTGITHDQYESGKYSKDDIDYYKDQYCASRDTE